ncbi:MULTISPECIES: porin [unclassified Rudaea]|nr:MULTISPECIES: porin [unclassified Rudaea]
MVTYARSAGFARTIRTPASRLILARRRIAAGLALLVCAWAGVAHADDSLTWNGITLYGAFDIGVAYQSHGAPLSQDWFVGVQYLIAKNSNKSITSVAPNGLSQSKLGLRGNEALTDDLSFVFDVEMGFDPQSGRLADALASLAHNNGKALADQTSAGDSSRAGQIFNGPAVAGLSSPTWGTLTVGRNNTLLLDNILKYDPMGGSYAFSVIGLSGVVAGMGATQDARLDGSLKYFYKQDGFRAGVLYQPGKTDSSPGKAWQGDIGFDYAGLSVDGIYGHKDDAISAASLSPAQATTAPQDSLAATISDNTSYTLAGSYLIGAIKAFLGYEHIRYENPSNPLAAGFTGLGGYFFSFSNNAAFPRPKVLQASWGGLKYRITNDFDITGAFYHYDQNSYGVKSCSDTSVPTCSGTYDAYSAVADYRLSKRFDVYGGAMYSKAAGGQASGYLHHSNLSPMVGMRFRF